MKVTNTGSQQLQGVVQKKSDKADSTKSGESKIKTSSAETGGAAAVALSAKAKDAQKIKDVAMKSSPDVDEAKVAKFQQLIDSGNYKVDAKKVSDKMVDEQFAMLGADVE